jgi:hypothetical protein
MMSYRLTFITPLFSKGSYDQIPEVRPSSVRGQLHFWFRALGGNPADENAIFGSVHSRPVLASKVIVRVGNIHGNTEEFKTLPHKHGGQASPKWAYSPGTTFDLHLLERLGGLSEAHRNAFGRTVQAWLLTGTLGLRSTRAGGSFIWQPLTSCGDKMPESIEAYSARCANILGDAPLRFVLMDQAFQSAEDARRTVSDTLGGRQDTHGSNDLARLNYPLGKVFGGRKTSPLRFRIIKLVGGFYILAIWDDRGQVTGNHPQDFSAVIELLAQKGKPIGNLLKQCSNL